MALDLLAHIRRHRLQDVQVPEFILHADIFLGCGFVAWRMQLDCPQWLKRLPQVVNLLLDVLNESVGAPIALQGLVLLCLAKGPSIDVGSRRRMQEADVL